jgi:hypothetical protein
MSDFTAKANIYRVEVKRAGGLRHLPGPKAVRSGTIAECVTWIMAKRPDDRKTYFMTVPLEAGLINKELRYQDIEAVSQRPDFPK